MFEIVLICMIALFTIYLVVDTKRKLKIRDKACNIVLNSAKLKSDNYCIDDAIESLKESNAVIHYDCMKDI